MASHSIVSLAASTFGGGDPKQDAAIAQRRALEAERLKRIKDPKLRTMGVDLDALNAQIAEKEEQKAAERALEQAYDEQRLLQDQRLAYLEQERLRAERANHAALLEFHKNMQGKEKSREFDLNDPKANLKSGYPEDNSQVSVSAMQKFEGEDGNHALKMRLQNEELQAWCAEAIRLKAEAKAKEAEAEAAHMARAMEMDALKANLEAAARHARKEAQASLAEYNLAMVAAKQERERARQAADMQDNISEMQANLANAAMADDPAFGRSFLNPNRLRRDHYKGMSAAEKEAIKQEQIAQRDLYLERKAREKAEEEAVNAQMDQYAKMQLYNDAQEAALRAEMRKKVMEENQSLAASQLAAKTYLNTKVFNNEIDDSFFEQFNTTSR
eukprot:CAMPEP_0182825002 /NCGR_PEP_ID=MMETSP0006_2-20121128/15598_1 /TAXON_ID=97485 /ORGANISM="Prymnesium parvum, Strain Texoma1" /LENGTH=385 /DNA_ID=CAMNT_0024952051 /DNA_START=37 /DNA_END=1194 /DNA_ORIENTATION=-